MLNLVHGVKQVVDSLLTHPKAKAISFVGSSAVAKYVYATAAANGKRVQALGGAKKWANNQITSDQRPLNCLPAAHIVRDEHANLIEPKPHNETDQLLRTTPYRDAP